MSKTTYPVFGEMLPTTEDIQLIVDSFKEEDRKRLTADGIFNPGIVNTIDDYVQEGSNKNTLKIIPFIAYTRSGNRIEVSNTYDFLTPAESGKITVNDDNIVDKQKNIPYWNHYSKNYTNFTEATNTTFSILIDELKPSSILQGVKLNFTQTFRGCGDVYVSIGTSTEPEKFTPKFLISEETEDTNIETSNVLYCESGSQYIPVYATFTCSLNTLNNLTAGSLSISLCITDVSNVEYEEKEIEGPLSLKNISGIWKENMTYYIVARYKVIQSDERSINIKDDDIDLSSKPFYARETDSFDFFALRRTGSYIDSLTDNDVKLAKVTTDNYGNITIFTNSYDESNKVYNTEYLTLPETRLKIYSENIVRTEGGTINGILNFTKNSSINFNNDNEKIFNISLSNNNLNVFNTENNGLSFRPDGNLYTVNGSETNKILSFSDLRINKIGLTGGDINLETNKIYSMIINSDTNFVLQDPENKNILNQIEIQLYLSEKVNINLGTNIYFDNAVPTFLADSFYTVIYEYDSLRNAWVAGASKKS